MGKQEMQKQNPDWKQWIPIYGVGKAIKDYLDEKPSLIDLKNHPLRYCTSSVYHGLTASGIIIGSIAGSLELLVK